MNRIKILFLNIFLLLLLIINRFFYYINNVITKFVTYLSILKENNHIKKYEIDKNIYNYNINFHCTYDDINETVNIKIKNNEINLTKEEFEIFLNIFTELNKKIIK